MTMNPASATTDQQNAEAVDVIKNKCNCSCRGSCNNNDTKEAKVIVVVAVNLNKWNHHHYHCHLDQLLVVIDDNIILTTTMLFAERMRKMFDFICPCRMNRLCHQFRYIDSWLMMLITTRRRRYNDWCRLVAHQFGLVLVAVGMSS